MVASLALGLADDAAAHLLPRHDNDRLRGDHPADHRALGAGHRRHVGLAGHSRHQHFRHRPAKGRCSITTFWSLRSAFAMIVAARVRHSALGRAMIATRDSEIAAEQSGVDTTRTKLIAFMIGAVYAGLAGCLYASSIRFISPDSFSGTQAILLMTMLIVGGMGSIVGCVFGAVALTILPEALAVSRPVVPRPLWPRRHRRDRACAGRTGIGRTANSSCAGRVCDDDRADYNCARGHAPLWRIRRAR